MPRKTGKRKRKRKKIKNKQNRIFIGFFIFFMFAAYLIGSGLTLAMKTKTPIEIARFGSIEKILSSKGIILRNEKVIHSPAAGKIEYNYGEGEKVPKDAIVCEIVNDEQYKLLHKKINEIDTDISKVQEERKEFLWFQKDIDQINNTIGELIENYQYSRTSKNPYDIYSIKKEINNNIDKRKQLLTSESKGKIKELIAEKMNYENQLENNISLVKTPISGILSFHIDQFEELTVDRLTEEHFQMKSSVTKEEENINIDMNQSIFKIIDDYEWNVAILLNENEARDWSTGDIKNLRFPNHNSLELSFEIQEINRLNNKVIVIFSSNHQMNIFLKERFIEVEILEADYEGIKISNSSIIEKNLLKIPKDCLIKSGNNTGVIKYIEGNPLFTPIDTISEDEENVYVSQDFESLHLYDEIIWQEDQKQEIYKINDIITMQGVYVANQGYAKFRKIEVISQNTDYSIISNATPYGVRIYDRIVVNVQSMKENTFFQ